MDRTELLTLIPAYAIGALDHDDRVEVESWIQTDPEAQAILAEYRAVADQLVALAPLHSAPDHLQADLRRRLAASRQAAPAAQEAPAPPSAAPKWSSRRVRVALFAAAICAVIVAGLAIVRIASAPGPESTPSPADIYTRLLSEQGASRYSVVPGDVSEDLWGDIVVSHDGKQAVMRVGDLPVIGEDQVFQMWLIDASGTRTSGGLFWGHDSQTVFVVVPFAQPIADYRAVGVSLEPVGGSPYADQPTGPRVLSVPLS